jgi:hypothetical protein
MKGTFISTTVCVSIVFCQQFDGDVSLQVSLQNISQHETHLHVLSSSYIKNAFPLELHVLSSSYIKNAFPLELHVLSSSYINRYEILHTLNLGCRFITLRKSCNNQRPRCDIACLHVTNQLYHGFPIYTVK